MIAEGQQRTTDLTIRRLAAGAIAMVVLDVAFTVALAALDPNYNHWRQYISELGEEGRPYAALFNAWCLVYGLLFAGFAVALGRALKSHAVLIAPLIIAACSAASGLFPCDPGCACQTPIAQVHMLIGYVALPANILAPLLAWSAMKADAAWHGFRGFTLAVAFLLLASTLYLAACHFLGRERYECPVGLAQRLILGIQYVWIVAVAMQLWRRGPTTRGAVSRRA